MNPSIISYLMNRSSRSTDRSNWKTMKDQDDHSSSLLKGQNYDTLFKSSDWFIDPEHDSCGNPQHGAALIHVFDDEGASLASSPVIPDFEANESPESLDSSEEPELQAQSQGFLIPDVNRGTVGSPLQPSLASTIKGDNWINQLVARRRIWIAVENSLQSPPTPESFVCVPDHQLPNQIQDALRNYIDTHLPHPSHPTDPKAGDHEESTGSGLSVATLDGVPDAAKFFRPSESSRQVYDASSSAVAGTAGATSKINVPSQSELSQPTPVLLAAQAQSEILGHTSATSAMISEKPPALTAVAIDLAKQKTTGLEVPNDEIERQWKRRSSLIAAAGDVFTTSKSSRRRRASIANDDDSATSDVAVASDVKKFIDTSEINDNDVFCGPGERSNSNVGNKIYLDVVSKWKEDYSNAGENNEKKRRIAQVVEQHIHTSGGRFIEPVADGLKKYGEYKKALENGYKVKKDKSHVPLSRKASKARQMFVNYWDNLTSSEEFNKEKSKDTWYVVSDEMRREKVAQCLRN